ncbi:MAG: phosphatase PAP2 family protein [Candidatus Marinimicrobia bacterium]|nr:phosphatase PAP2 family protein [Candidatus Neomarinimicrobiota bacterium]
MIEKIPVSLTDRIILFYELVLSVLLILFQSDRVDTTHHLMINAIIIVGVISFGRFNTSSNIIKCIRTFYPIALMGLLYPQACELRFLFSPQEFDPILLRWEINLFGAEWYRVFSQLPVIILEFFHGIYFFYYIALFLFASLAWRSKPTLVSQYIFTLTLSSLLHHFIIISFPASGPVPLRAELMPDGFLFIPIMDWIYANADKGGGAFPSLHVASTIILSKFAIRFNSNHRIFVFGLALGIILSTIVGSFHYAIDGLAGIITGWLAYHLGNWLFLRLHYEES